MLGRGGVSAALVAVMLGVACAPSRVDPEASVVVRSRVVAPDGTPAEGRPVTAVVQPGASDVLFGLPLTLGTLGLVCLADDVPKVCADRLRTRTGTDGTFRFELQGRDVRGLFGEVRRLVVAAAGSGDGGATGAVTTAGFDANATDIALPDIRLWGARVALEEAGGEVRGSWPALPTDYGTAGRASLSFERAGGEVVWWAPAGATGGSVDGRVLEDTAGVAVATLEASGGTGDLDVSFAYRSAGTAYAAGAGAPASRGVGCRVDGGPQLVPCPLTDGDFSRSSGLAGSAALVQLAEPRPVRLVVVRGCTAPCAVEAVEPSGAVRALGSVQGPFAALVPAAPVVAGAVRVTGALAGLLEVSVWDGPGERPLLRPAGGGDAGGGGRGAEPGGRSGAGRSGPAQGRDRFPWAWVAVVLGVGVAGLAAGVAVSKRRKPWEESRIGPGSSA